MKDFPEFAAVFVLGGLLGLATDAAALIKFLGDNTFESITVSLNMIIIALVVSNMWRKK